jgi:hypothetical protein
LPSSFGSQKLPCFVKQAGCVAWATLGPAASNPKGMGGSFHSIQMPAFDFNAAAIQSIPQVRTSPMMPVDTRANMPDGLECGLREGS